MNPASQMEQTRPVPLPPPDPDSNNVRCQVVGALDRPDGHAFVWSAAEVLQLPNPVSESTELPGLRSYIIGQVANGGVAVQLQTGLLAWMVNAAAQLSMNTTNGSKAALNVLKALQNEVRAQAGRTVSPVAAEFISSAVFDLATALD